MAQQQAKTKDHPDVKAMETQRDERAKSNEAAMKRMDESRPTPTQEENDLAKLGVHVDQKQDDGSGQTVISDVYVANVPLPPGGAQPKVPEAKVDHKTAPKKEW
jgi:hypothetical protein